MLSGWWGGRLAEAFTIDCGNWIIYIEVDQRGRNCNKSKEKDIE